MKQKFLIGIMVLMVICTATVSAQAMTTWNWAAYNLNFDVPNDFKVTQNTATIFTASSSDNQFSVEFAPWRDASLGAYDVAYAALYSAEGYWTNITVDEEDWIDSGYDESYVIVGTANKDGWVLNYVIVGLIDPDSADNLFARFSWWDGAYNDYYENQALAIISSIR